jgi:hypothetical protein
MCAISSFQVPNVKAQFDEIFKVAKKLEKTHRKDD